MVLQKPTNLDGDYVHHWLAVMHLTCTNILHELLNTWQTACSERCQKALFLLHVCHTNPVMYTLSSLKDWRVRKLRSSQTSDFPSLYAALSFQVCNPQENEKKKILVSSKLCTQTTTTEVRKKDTVVKKMHLGLHISKTRPHITPPKILARNQNVHSTLRTFARTREAWKKTGSYNDATIDEMMRPQAAIAWTHFFHVLYITCAACYIIHVDRLTRHSCGSAGYEYGSHSSYSLSLKPVREMLLSTWCDSRNRALGTFRA